MNYRVRPKGDSRRYTSVTAIWHIAMQVAGAAHSINCASAAPRIIGGCKTELTRVICAWEGCDVRHPPLENEINPILERVSSASKTGECLTERG